MNSRSSQLTRAACALIAAGSLAACARDEPPPADTVTRAARSESQATAAGVHGDIGFEPADYLDDPALAGADLERGKLLSLACAACHTFGAGERTLIGPNLHGVFGRRAASLPDFAYSSALRATELHWTPRSLAAWLADPQGFVSGTTMTFTGYHSAEDRRDLIAYLLRATQ